MKNEIKNIELDIKWNDIIEDQQQIIRLDKLAKVKESIETANTKQELEALLIDAEVLLKLINKHNKEFVKPAKDALNSYRKIVLDYETLTTKEAKAVKDKIKNKIEELEKEPFEEEVIEVKEHICKCGICGKVMN